MKKKLIIAVAALCSGIIPAKAQHTGTIERTYISTDRQIYMAGEDILCSAFCVERNDGVSLSDLSSIAYVEIHSSEGPALTGKVALTGGRGAGCIHIPKTLPTGNYKLFAYTAQNRNEEGLDYARISRTISIFNPYSGSRVKGGVDVVPDGDYRQGGGNMEGFGPIGLEAPTTGAQGGRIRVKLTNASDAAVTLSIGITLDDGIHIPERSTMREFVAVPAGDRSFSGRFIAEYEGETLRGHVTGLDPSKMAGVAGRVAFISSPGERGDLYAATIENDGSVLFNTCNIYGDKDLLCEIENLPGDLNCHIEFESPFICPDAGEVERLSIYKGLNDRLIQRSIGSQVEKAFGTDTLHALLPLRGNFLLSSGAVTYNLDDYTRFPLMEEVFTEFVSEMKVRKAEDGSRDIRVMLNSTRGARFSKENSLMLIDGVPVFNQEKVCSYDPLLVKSINIFTDTYYVGPRSYDGIANFITYKRNLPGLKFDDNVRVIAFQGAGIPQARTWETVPDNFPDYRATLYWHPVVDVEAGGGLTFECVLPGYAGKFIITAEGLTSDGKPVQLCHEFEVK